MQDIILITEIYFPLFKKLLPGNCKPGTEGEYLLGIIDGEGDAAAVLWYRFHGFRYDILYIGVRPDLRRQGVGTLLLDTFLNSIYESGLVFPVYLSFLDTPENAGLRCFIESMDRFFDLEETTLFEVAREHLDSSEIMTKLGERKNGSTYFFNLAGDIRRDFLKRLDDEMPDLSEELKDDIGGFIPQLCICAQRDNKVVSAMLVKERDDGNLEIAYCYNDDKSGNSLIDVLGRAKEIFDRRYKTRKIYFETINDSSYLLACKLFGDPFVRRQIVHKVWDFSV